MMRLLPLLALVAMACTPEPPLPDTDFDAVPELLYFERLGLGQRTQLADTTEVLIRDAATWSIYQDSLETPGPFRAVDFEQAMVLLVSVPAETGGYGVEFETAELIDGEIVVTYALV